MTDDDLKRRTHEALTQATAALNETDILMEVSKCRVAYNDAMRRLRAAWKRAGRCIQCGRRAEAGKARCAYHLKAANDSAARMRQSA